MATYHLSTCIISRGRERSVASSLSYIWGEWVYDKYLGEWHDNTRRTDVLHKEIYLPPSVPLDYQNPQRLVDALNDSERRIDSQMARSIIMALPNEMDINQQIELVREFIDQYFIANNMCAVFAIHSGRKDRHKESEVNCTTDMRKANPHAHVIAPIRQIGESGFYRTKLETRQFNTKKFLYSMREGWADIQNRGYERIGLPTRVTHESLYVQGINRKPTVHLSAKDISLEQRGIQTARGNINRQILAEERTKEHQRQQERERSHQYERTRIYERSL